MSYSIVADGVERPITDMELHALLDRLDRQGLVRRNKAGEIVEETACAAIASSLRTQIAEGESALRVESELKPALLGLLHHWVGDPDFSERLMTIRYALHAELTDQTIRA